MDFLSIRILTENPKPLAGFYEQVTGLTATWLSDDFAELATPTGTFAIAHLRTMTQFATGAASPAANRSVIFELRVDDVDATYARIKPLIGTAVQEPTTMPWGNRSLLFRDPDGNLVNYFQPVTPQAIARFADKLKR